MFRRAIAYAAILVVLGFAGVVATMVRYGSLHPCAWLRIDASRQSDLPDALVEARLRGIFLLRGITTPSASDCVTEWWRVRRLGLPESGPS